MIKQQYKASLALQRSVDRIMEKIDEQVVLLREYMHDEPYIIREKEVMTKKDFEALAEALARTRPENRYANHAEQWRRDRETIMAVCYRFNSNFNREKFIKRTEFDSYLFGASNDN